LQCIGEWILNWLVPWRHSVSPQLTKKGARRGTASSTIARDAEAQSQSANISRATFVCIRFLVDPGGAGNYRCWLADFRTPPGLPVGLV